MIKKTKSEKRFECNHNILCDNGNNTLMNIAIQIEERRKRNLENNYNI